MQLNSSSSRSIFTVDLEEYFHAVGFACLADPAGWDAYPRRCVNSTLFLLDLLDAAGATATFFVLGWIADRESHLIRQIAARGHEIACHSYWHRLVYQLSPAEFRQDTIRARDAIQQASGCRMHGYRAPCFSVTRKSAWAYDVLAELGFTYDSSVFPIRHDLYGWPEASRYPFLAGHGHILAVPMTTFSVRNRVNVPLGGGGYLRLFPWSVTRRAILRAEEQGILLVSYVHPWELDPDQPLMSGTLRARLRHYTNLNSTLGKLRNLLAFRKFSSFRDSGLIPPERVSVAAGGQH